MRSLLFIVILLIGKAASAQHVSVMPMVGLSSATVGSHAYGGQKPALSKQAIWKFQTGLLFSKQISPPFSVSAGAFYSQKGYRARYVAPVFSWSQSISYKHEFSYLEVPATARLTLGKSNTRFFLQAGPYAAYLVKYSTNDGRLNGENKPALNSPFFNRWDVGFCSGMGVHIKAGSGDLVMEIRYNHGFRNVHNKSEMHALKSTGTHEVTGLLLGYAIPVGKP